MRTAHLKGLLVGSGFGSYLTYIISTPEHMLLNYLGSALIGIAVFWELTSKSGKNPFDGAVDGYIVGLLTGFSLGISIASFVAFSTPLFLTGLISLGLAFLYYLHYRKDKLWLEG